MKKRAAIAVIGLWVVVAAAPAAGARDAIRIVGSAAILPFVQTVAENFAVHFDHPPPSLEVTGTGRGMRMFCSGVGYQHPDICATARLATDAELTHCRRNGVEAVVEIAVGLDAIALVNTTAARRIDLTPAQLAEALVAQMPRDGRFVPNPHRSWADIDPNLPDRPIRVMGPSPSSAYFDAFTTLVLDRGCAHAPGFAALSAAERTTICRRLRKDGAFIPGLNNDSAVLQWLRDHPRAFAVAPLILAQHYPEFVRANPIAGAAPDSASVSSGTYPLARPIYLYVKKRHVAAVPGLQQFLYEFSAERAIGPDGYLADNGFFHLDDQGRNHARDFALSLAPLRR